MPQENDRWLWTAAIFLFVGIEAAGFQMRGALLPSLERTFVVSPALLGLVATAGTVGFVLTVLAFGLFAGRIDVRPALIGSSCAIAVSLLAMGLAPVFLVYLAALFVRGTATGPFRALDRTILSHLYPDARGAMFNLYGLVWAVGATSGPLLVTVVLLLGNWRFAYLFLAATLLPVIYLVYRLDVPTSFASERAVTRSELKSVVRQPGIGGMAVVLVLNGGIEGSLFTWLPYFASRSLQVAYPNMVLTAFLLAYVPARLFYTVVVDRFRYAIDLVIGLAALALPLLGVLLFVVRGIELYAVAFALGFVVSGVFPTMSAFGVELQPEFSGPINAIATTASYTGIALVPAIVGFLAAGSTIRTALGSLLVLLVVLIGVTMVTRYRVRMNTARG